MQIKTSDFTAEIYNTYLVDTSENDINVILPDATQCNMDAQSWFLNAGNHNIIYTSPNGQTLNNNSSYTNDVQWQSDAWLTDQENWYKF